MAQQVKQWKSDDGKIYDTEKEALQADLIYWKTLGKKWLEHEEQSGKYRMAYHERGSHQ